ncbi:MAG: SRPBCC family protein [Actinomycetota bacterium]|nr:SRPBCC family protein [Actinomycetota bacterium]
MEIANSFEVPAPVEQVWSFLLDVERVAPCMPGAELTETIDDSNWKGKVKIKLGPVSLNFSGKVTMVERDDGAHRVVLKASGMEQRGKGAASATVTSTLERIDGGTRVNVLQDLTVQGQAAQFSRGMMQDVTAKLTQQFADNLKQNIGATPETTATGTSGEAPPRAVVVAKPVSGIRLGLSALGSALARFFKRLLGRRKSK